MTAPFALVELDATAMLLLILGFLVVFSVLFSRQIDRLGVPVVLLFLVLGMLGGSEGLGGLVFDDYHFAVRIGTVYLVLILFEGGMSTRASTVRAVLAPSAVLATVGVVLTAALVAAFARLLGIPWTHALLLGSVVSSTDAAAVLAVLRGGGLSLRPSVGRTLEVESCINDPMAVILTVTMIEVIGGQQAGLDVLWGVPQQLLVGGLVGAALGVIGRKLITWIPPSTVALYPAMTLGLSFLSFGAATVAAGSGLLAVYVTGLVLGNSQLPYQHGLSRVHSALSWMSQIALFVMLGLLVFPSKLLGVATIGLAIGLFLAFVARPLAVLVCLLPLRTPAAEIGYIGWVGLRGAVPIILGAFPMLGEVPGADAVFHLVFFIVVVSAILPGATIRTVTRWFGMAVPEEPQPAAMLEIHSPHPLRTEIASFFIEPEAAVCGASLAEIEFMPDVAVMLIVRGSELVAPRGPTVLKPGDHVYVFFPPEQRRYVQLLFGRAEH